MSTQQTRTVTRYYLHITVVLADGTSKLLPETCQDLETAGRMVAGALGVEFVGAVATALGNPAHKAGSWNFSLDGRLVATTTSEQVTAEELIPWLWYVTGASDYPASIADGGNWERTGKTGSSAGTRCAEYRSGYNTAWFTMDSTKVTGAVQANEEC